MKLRLFLLIIFAPTAAAAQANVPIYGQPRQEYQTTTTPQYRPIARPPIQPAYEPQEIYIDRRAAHLEREQRNIPLNEESWKRRDLDD